jgi:ribosomal protein L34E
MTATATEANGRAMELARGIVEKYLPASGELRDWTVSEIEASLQEDMTRLARGIVETRLEADPRRVVAKPRCPDCGRALGGVGKEIQTHRHTVFGTTRYRRTYGICRPCGAAFSPSGQRVALRQGLL